MLRTQDSWANIPPELTGLVLGRLHAHADRVRFAAVCPQWRSAARQVKLPPPLPLLALKEGDIFYRMPRGEPLHFAGYRNGHLAGCKDGFDTACGNWLVYHRYLDLLLLDPFSGATMTLPAPSSIHLDDDAEGDESMDGHDSGDEVEDSEEGHDSADESDDDSEDGSAPSRGHLPDGKKGDDFSRAGRDSADEAEDSEDGHDSADKGDDFEDGSAPSSVLPNENKGDDSSDGHDSADESKDSEGGHGSVGEHDESEMESRDVKYFEVVRLVVCSPNLIAALLKGSETNRIAVCRPGGSKWSVAWELSLWVTDMAFYQGKLYVVDYHEDLFALNISVDDKTGDPRVSQIGRVINVNQFDNELSLLRMLYLVQSCGSLLLVRRSIFYMHVHGDGQIHTFAGQCEPDLLILEADFARSQWVKVTTLADSQALFLGPCSRAVCMPQNDSPGNHVWFLDDYKDFHLWSRLSSDTSSVANPKPFSPLPMISWKGYLGNAGAAWIFPAN